ncbi:MAG: bifunctional 4-hydroxy-2-oxoglutarate aldolase/2-dehydro-3-deoxy-phosphogluconate aldolase [Anaerolineae bacterium]
MDRNQLLTEIIDSGVVAIVRLSSSEGLLRVAKAIAAGGVRHIEFTMTTPGALQTLASAASSLGPDVVLGAGTVLDPETARAAILSGARFIVAPNLNRDVITLCHRYGAVCMPGALTPTEILQAWEWGADVVKVFPADSFGPAYIRAVRAPLPQVRLAPVGGVTIDNTADYMRAGAACVGVGSSLVNDRLIAEADWAGLTARACAFVEAVQTGRSA